MKNLFIGSLSLFALVGCGGTPVENGGESPASEHAASEHAEVSGTLLAAVSLSPTHTINFYDRGLQGMVQELYDLDSERPVLRGQNLVEHGHYAELYERLAGDAPDADALDRLRAFDEAARAQVPTEEADLDSPPVTDFRGYDPNAGNSIIEKDFWSDVDRFRQGACGGCIGYDGKKENIGEPASWPACTTAPEICMFLGAGESTFRRKTRNVDVWNENFSFTSSSDLIIALNDPCEHRSWWEASPVLSPNGCWNDGTQIFRIPLGPRTSGGVILTSSTTWTLNYWMTGPEFTGLKIDLF